MMIICTQCGINQLETSSYCSTCGTILERDRTVSLKSRKSSVVQWEQRGDSLFGPLFSSMGTLLSSPVEFYRTISERSKLSSAFTFALLVLYLVLPTQMLYRSIFAVGLETSADYFAWFVTTPALLLVCYTFFVTLQSGSNHLLVKITGAQKVPFKQTMVATCYATTPIVLYLLPLPFIIPLVVVVWNFVLQVIGLSEVHETSRMRMFLTLFIPTIISLLMFLGSLLLLSMFVAMVFAGSTNYSGFTIQDILEMSR